MVLAGIGWRGTRLAPPLMPLPAAAVRQRRRFDIFD